MSVKEEEFNRIVRDQMGFEPSECDPVTLDLLRQKFFGDKKDKKKSKAEKQRESKKANIQDKYKEDSTALLVAHKEEDVHLDLKTVKKKARGDPSSTVLAN